MFPHSNDNRNYINDKVAVIDYAKNVTWSFRKAFFFGGLLSLPYCAVITVLAITGNTTAVLLMLLPPLVIAVAMFIIHSLAKSNF